MKKTKIRALILDYGGVISEPQRPENVKNMLQILKQDPTDFRQLYQSRRENYDKGQLSGEEYWRDILQHYGLDRHVTDIARLIQEDVESWTHINEPMIRFIKESRNQLHRLAIISNMTRDTLAFLQSQCQWLELFDELIFSCEIGYNKPDRRIYAACLSRLEMPPPECLFVDDSPANIRGAMQAGMNVIYFKSFPEFRQALDRNFYFAH
jgi:putative hydrolase of the HAD superfamily